MNGQDFAQPSVTDLGDVWYVERRDDRYYISSDLCGSYNRNRAAMFGTRHEAYQHKWATVAKGWVVGALRIVHVRRKRTVTRKVRP